MEPGALCLASAGGQQAPILAAAGARVTVFDNSPRQLDQDRFVANRDGLDMKFIEGDMADLSVLPDESSTSFFILAQTRCAERDSGLAGMLSCSEKRGHLDGRLHQSDAVHLRRWTQENGNLEVRYSLPYSDLDHVDEDHIREAIREGKPLEFGHTLED